MTIVGAAIMVPNTERDLDEVISQGAENIILKLMDYAIKNNASDIHFQPERAGGDRYTLRIRFRIDGILVDYDADYKHLVSEKIIGYIRTNSGVKLDDYRSPQDGRLAIRFYEKMVRSINGRIIERDDKIELPRKEKDYLHYDVRVNTLPTPLESSGGFAQRIVMRFLDSRRAKIALADSGMLKPTEESLRSLVRRGKGMILCVGPTGSGKSSTLYALLNEINQPGINIMTIEDPIEYQLPGITQTQPNAKMSFAEGVKAFLRQDPDVIMVGEIRDSETVQVAVKAAMTGHMVLSTLHTNDAVATVSRLSEMGVPEYLIADSLISVLSQRLLRCACVTCSEVVKCPIYELGEKFNIKPDRVDDILKNIGFKAPDVIKVRKETIKKVPDCLECENIHLDCKNKGLKCKYICSECENKGYHGRLAAHELLEVTPVIAKMIRDNASTTDIQKEAQKAGMISILEDAFVKVLLGKTTHEEVLRVLDI